METDIVVIGGGAAGCMAALFAAQSGAKVTLLERNQKLGRKIYITGKGRCNLTNASSVQECMANIPRNPRFLTSALTQFPPEEVMSFFEVKGEYCPGKSRGIHPAGWQCDRRQMRKRLSDTL